MVYLWKMVIFHGKLLNNQMVSLFPNDETWVFDFDPGTETDHRWNGLAIGWQAQLLVDRALVALDALFLPGAPVTGWLVVAWGWSKPTKPKRGSFAIKHGIDKGIIPFDCNWTKIDYIYIFIIQYNQQTIHHLPVMVTLQMLGSAEASKIVDSRPGTRRKMAGQSWHRGGVLSRLSDFLVGHILVYPHSFAVNSWSILTLW